MVTKVKSGNGQNMVARGDQKYELVKLSVVTMSLAKLTVHWRIALLILHIICVPDYSALWTLKALETSLQGMFTLLILLVQCDAINVHGNFNGVTGGSDDPAPILSGNGEFTM